jgi:CTP:molybdopterin cytidylyltransferase MocA
VSKVAAVVLAAGEGSRFGGSKQRLLLPRVLERLRLAPLDEIVIVEGAHPLAGIALPEDPPSRFVRCDRWADGPGVSLRCGVEALAANVDAAIVVLADGPDLSPESVARVIETWCERDALVVAASYGGVRGHPLLIARSAWGAIPTEGMRLVEPQLVACDDLGAPGDVDRPDDLPPRAHG